VLYLWLLGTFKGLNFNLFLAVFSAIFPHSDSLFHIIQSKSSDILFCIEKSDTHLKKKSYPPWEGILKMTPSSYVVKRNRVEPLEGEDKKIDLQEHAYGNY